MVMHAGKIPLYIYFFEMDYLAESTVLLPLILAVFIGKNMGKQILSFIPEDLFIKLFKGLLTIISIRLVLNYFIN